MRSKSILVFSLITTTFCFILTSCASGPKAPEKGTPAFYWIAAKESWAAGDYMKTADNLDRAMKGSTEHEAEARPWSLVLTAGLAKGYMDLADSFELGARANKTNPAAFRKQVSDYRRLARGLSLQFVERYREFEKSAGDQVPLAFTFPSGSQAQPPLLTRVSSGILPPATEIDSAQRAMLQRSVILSAARAAGTAGDSSKAQEMFRSGDLKVPRSDFILAQAHALQDMAELYAPLKLDEPEKMRMLAEEAQRALKNVPESKDVKVLNERIQKALKPAKKAS